MTAATGASKYSEVQTESMNDIVLRYSPLVKRIAHHLLLRMPSCVQIDDLIQSGMIGLLEAAKKYDLSKGASFET
ncbi:MAG: sigma factor, partial [Pseudomonas sp.]